MSLRIALVHVADKGGGAERSVLTLHQSLLALGHHSRLFVASRQLDEPGVIQIPQDRTVPGLLRVTRRLEERWGIQNLYAPWFRSLDRLIGDVDILHFHSLWKLRNAFADLTGIVRLSRKYPTVMTLRDGWMMTGHCACPIGCERWRTGCGSCPDLQRAPAIPSDWTALNWKRKKRTLQKSTLHITAVSSWLKQQAEQSPIFAGKPIHVVHNSVDSSAFAPGSMRTARESLGVPQDAFVVLLAGQSIEGILQGVSQHAVLALNALNDSSILTLLVGNSSAQVAGALRTPSLQIPFRHTSEEMAKCYQAVDLTIVPSEYETFGRVAAESLFCGTPVVAFATGGLTDIVQDGISGRLVATGDVDGLKEAIAEFRAAPQLLQQIRKTCSIFARQRFSTERIAAEYLDVYRTVLESRGRKMPINTLPGLQAVLPTAQVLGVQAALVDDTGSLCGQPATISCIIPAMNCEPWLERAVRSVLDTKYPRLEILIVDDGSTDSTLQVAQDLQRQFPDTIRVLQHPEGRNLGVSASRNLGLTESNGDWICLLDADDYVYPHRFDSAAKILASQPDVDGVHQLAEVVFSSQEAGERWFTDQHLFGFDKPIAAGQLLEKLLQGRCWATSAIVFRRTLLDRTGLFAEHLKIAEDCHLWFRMAAVGTIVSGDLTQPVSAYWRRTDSAYQPSAESRISMVQAMSGFLQWLKTTGCSPAQQSQATDAVRTYVLNGLTESRFAKQRVLAWRIGLQGVRVLPSLLLNRGYCGQMARLAAGR